MSKVGRGKLWFIFGALRPADSPYGLDGGAGKGASDLRRSRREERGGDGDSGSRVGRLREFHPGYEDGIVSG